MAVTLYITSGSNFSINDLRESIPSCKAIKEYDQLQQDLAALVEAAKNLVTKSAENKGDITSEDFGKVWKAIAAAEALGGR